MALCVFRFLLIAVLTVVFVASEKIPRYVTVVFFPNSSSLDPLHHDLTVIPVPSSPPDLKNFCPKYAHVFLGEKLKGLCDDIVLSGFPEHTPEDVGSNEVFLFVNWNTTNLTDTTQFTFTTSDGTPQGSIYFQLFGRWNTDDGLSAQNAVIDLANRNQLQTYTGAVKYPPRFFTVIVSLDESFVDPVALHIPEEEYKGDFCFRMRHIFTTENIIKHCLDAMLSSFPYPPGDFGSNEILLFIHDNLTSVASTTQFVLSIGAPADSTVGRPACDMLIQSFGVFAGDYRLKTQEFIVKLADEGSLQTFVGEFCLQVKTLNRLVSIILFLLIILVLVRLLMCYLGPPTTPYRFFTLIMSTSTENQFDDPVVLQLPRVPGDFCKRNKDRMSNETMVKQCDAIVSKLRNFPWPIPALNQRDYTSEVFAFINLEVDLLDLTQFTVNLGRPNEDPAIYVQCFGLWDVLSTDVGTAFVMNRELVGLGNRSEYATEGL